MADSLSCGQAARLAVVLLAGASLAACATVQPHYPNRAEGPQRAPAGQGVYKVGAPYQVGGVWYVPREQPDYDQTGVASWYGDEFHQKTTANGELFDMNAVSGAHTTLPLPSMVEVTNLDNGRKLTVRVNDRGPFVGDRIIDLSHEAARELGYDRQGLAHVRVRYVGPAPLLGPGAGYRTASNKPLPTRLPPPVVTQAAAKSPGPPATPEPDLAMELAAGSSLVPRAIPTAAAVTSQALPPITGAAISSAPLGSPAMEPPPTAVTQAASPLTQAALAPPPRAPGLRIQAGAYSSEANAQRAVSQLTAAGPAIIEPLQRDGTTLYRVVLPAPQDEAEAYALRDRIAEIGFSDARVVRTF